jgi:hypothetical protein
MKEVAEKHTVPHDEANWNESGERDMQQETNTAEATDVLPVQTSRVERIP